MGFITKEDIKNSINIINIADMFNVKVEEISAGNFDHRALCPSSEHSSGGEKTGSLYIDSKLNNYYCFGCQSNNNVIDFYMMCADVPFKVAFDELKNMMDPNTGSGVILLPVVSTRPTRIRISMLFRDKMFKNPLRVKEVSTIMQKTDHYLRLRPDDSSEYKYLKLLELKLKETFELRNFK